MFEAGTVQNAAVTYAMMLMCLLLSMLNVVWMFGIIAILIPKKSRHLSTTKVRLADESSAKIA